MATDLVLIRHSGLAPVPAMAVLQALPNDIAALPRVDREVAMQPFAPDVADGEWRRADRLIRQEVTQIQQLADGLGHPEFHYFGLTEIPQAVAFGAHWGDERALHLHDFDRDANSWRWPVADRTFEVEVLGEPHGSPIPARGAAILRVEISATVAEDDVRAVAPRDDLLAEMTIRPKAPTVPRIGLVRSAADVEEVRRCVRDALAKLRAHLANLESLHLFIATPASVSVAIGQELKPRNGVPVQTYRFRRQDEDPAYSEALLITATVPEGPGRLLDAAELEIVRRVRHDLWPRALNQVINYARARGEDCPADSPWYTALGERDLLSIVAPFPALPHLSKLIERLIQEGDTAIDERPFEGDYGYDKDRKQWRLGDLLALRLFQIFEKDEDAVYAIIRLFLFHEYLHDYHSLSKYTAAEVGKFANTLEHIDYTADTYALLHQLDWARIYDRDRVKDDAAKKAYLADQIDAIIRSFWAFDGTGPTVEWQARRIRRYLNWYWRQIQVQRAPDFATAMFLFNHAPRIEIAGLRQRAEGRRVYVRIDQLDPSTHLEMALVVEDERLVRISGGGASANLEGLLMAFRDGVHDDIKGFFRALYELVRQTGGDLPTLTPDGRPIREALRDRDRRR